MYFFHFLHQNHWQAAWLHSKVDFVPAGFDFPRRYFFMVNTRCRFDHVKLYLIKNSYIDESIDLICVKLHSWVHLFPVHIRSHHKHTMALKHLSVELLLAR